MNFPSLSAFSEPPANLWSDTVMDAEWGLEKGLYFHTALSYLLTEGWGRTPFLGQRTQNRIHVTSSEPVGAIVTGSSLEEKASHPRCFLIVYKEGKRGSFVASFLWPHPHHYILLSVSVD